MKGSIPYIRQLDGVRALAVIMVLMTHLWTYPIELPVLNRFFAVGWVGVDLFFVLSGFLITSILLKSRRDERYYSAFYARRALRIFPLYFAVLFFVFGLLPFLGSTVSVQNNALFYVLYLSNFAIASGGWQVFMLDITWSLSVEEQFYLIWPILVRWVEHIEPVCWSVALLLPLLRLALWTAGVDWIWLHMMMPLRADAFAVGALLALRPQRFQKLLLPLCTVFMALVASGQYDRQTELVGTIGYSLNAFLAAAFIATAIARPGWSAMLQWPPLSHIGRVSYGVYLLHPICLIVIGSGLKRMGLEGTLLLSGVQLVLVSTATVVVATVSYRFFESPLLRLKSRFQSSAPAATPKPITAHDPVLPSR